ncbi:MAG: hypothetical protein JNM88_16670 [Chitinophagaceae bacterium]|nr:hypothetical protein [Chitinophagaceae bacterium]
MKIPDGRDRCENPGWPGQVWKCADVVIFRIAIWAQVMAREKEIAYLVKATTNPVIKYKKTDNPANSVTYLTTGEYRFPLTRI